MHIKDTFGQTDALISEKWEIRIFKGAMHGNCKLRGIWVGLCSDLHSTIADQNVMGVEVSLMGSISIIWGNAKLTFNNKEIELWGSVNIHVKVKTSGNMNRFTFHGSKLASPSGVVRPVVDIGEQEAAGNYITFILDINLQRRRNVAWSFG